MCVFVILDRALLIKRESLLCVPKEQIKPFAIQRDGKPNSLFDNSSYSSPKIPLPMHHHLITTLRLKISTFELMVFQTLC